MATAKSHNRQKQDKFTVKVKTRLLRDGITVTSLASDLNLARNTVSIAINHPSMLPTVKARIARHLGLS